MRIRLFLRLFTLPQIVFQVDDSFVAHLYALKPQKLNLLIFASERKCVGNPAETVNHPVARYMGRIGIYMQRIAYHPGPSGIPRHKRHLTVGCDLAAGDFFNRFINQIKRIHICSIRRELPRSLLFLSD